MVIHSVVAFPWQGSGIAGTSVSIGDGKSVLTSTEGVYVVDNITTGTYAIQVCCCSGVPAKSLKS